MPVNSNPLAARALTQIGAIKAGTTVAATPTATAPVRTPRPPCRPWRRVTARPSCGSSECCRSR